MEKSIHRAEGVNVGFRSRGPNDVGRFYFQISMLKKKLPNGLNDPGTLLQRFLPGRQSFLFPAEGSIP